MKLTRRGLMNLAAGAALPLSLAAQAGAAERSKFRLAVTTDEIDDDLAVAVQFLQRFAIEHCEIRGLWGKYNTSNPMDRIREARRILDDGGIKLSILDTGFFKVRLPDTSTLEGKKDLDKQWKLLDGAFERAEALGTKLIRTFAFTYKRGTEPDSSLYPRIYELVEESAERAGKAGFKLAIENVSPSYVWTAKQSADLLKAVKHSALGLTWDPNNSAQGGDKNPFPKGYQMLDAKRIYHVHFRDFQFTDDGSAEWCGVGDGDFDHVGQLRAFLKDGYKGVVSLETHFEIDGSKAKASEYSMKGLLAAIEKV